MSPPKRPDVRLPLAVAAMALALAAASPHAQDPQRPPVFRSGVQTVAVYATVFDRAGELVRDLKREDFDVWDEGVKQNLSVFLNGIQPITAMLLVDTSQSMTLNLDLARAAAEQFLIRLLPGDQARVGSFSDAVVLAPGFTGDRDRLLYDVRERLHIGNPTRLWDAIDAGMTELAPLGGRRVLLLMTDGEDTLSRLSPYALLARVRVDELMIYAVQFRSTPLARQEVGTAAQGRGAGRGRGLPVAGDLLRQMTTATGGGYFSMRANDDVNATIARLTEELHYQYVLGFTPEKLDGKPHRIDVRVRGRQVSVRARQSYLAPAPGPGNR
jgi:Ca-activated chloride channel family protein